MTLSSCGWGDTEARHGLCVHVLVLAQAVYHPSEGYGHTYSTMSWAGLMGAITGYSSANIAISEKGTQWHDGGVVRYLF